MFIVVHLSYLSYLSLPYLSYLSYLLPLDASANAVAAAKNFIDFSKKPFLVMILSSFPPCPIRVLSSPALTIFPKISVGF